MSDCGCKGKTGCECDKGGSAPIFGPGTGGMRSFSPARGAQPNSGGWVGFKRADQMAEDTDRPIVQGGKSVAGRHVAQAFHTDDGGFVTTMAEGIGDNGYLIASEPHTGYFIPAGKR